MTRAAVWIAARLAEGLDHAHSRGLLHRDLKPSNILIADDGTPMLLDFNLSSSTDPDDREAGEKAMLGGTLPYMSPEHLDAFLADGITGADAVDERSDLYSLGLILFEMIAGEHPFPDPPRLPLSQALKALKQQRGKVPSLRAIKPEVSWGLDSIVRKCLDPDPTRRYAQARDLADDLDRFLADRPLKFAPDPSLRERVVKWTRRNPRLCGGSSIAGLAAVLIISFGGLIGFLYGNLRNLSARLDLQVFQADFAEARFLLNLTSGPVEHLSQGIARAQQSLDRQQIDPEGKWRGDSWVRRTTIHEQEVVREQTAELILLLARARVYLAGRHGSENDRRHALEWAITWLNRAERIDHPPPSTLYGDRARYLAALGRADLAKKDHEREAARTAVTCRDFMLAGSSLLARNDLAGAERSLLRAVDLDPRSFWSWFALGHCHFDQGRNLEAAGDFAACVVLEPKFAWPYLNRGLALARSGRLTEAREAYDHAIKANPRFGEAWLNRALVDLELNNLPDAERAMGQALALGQRDSGVFAAWAEILARRGDQARGELLFAKLLSSHPDNPLILTARGISRISSNPPKAEADLRRALSLDPLYARAHLGLALLLRNSQPRMALSEAESALRSDPELLDALQIRALLRARLGDLAAVRDAERLSQVQTPHRLYNAACTFALLIQTAKEERFSSQGIDLLDRALDAGFSPALARADPDLNALRVSPRFQEVLEKKRPSSQGNRSTPL
ncbi:MAG: hypothetical protein NVSMB9_18530 [Isosphaeraceae bacterium]